jgi:hypothetical protein
MRAVYRILVEKPDRKRPLGRRKQRLEDNIQMNLQEGDCQVMDWNKVAQYRDRWRGLVNAVMNLGVR